MLLAQGTAPIDLEKVHFNEGRLLAWFYSCYALCKDDGSTSCLLSLLAGVDHNSEKHHLRSGHEHLFAHPRPGATLEFEQVRLQKDDIANCMCATCVSVNL